MRLKKKQILDLARTLLKEGISELTDIEVDGFLSKELSDFEISNIISSFIEAQKNQNTELTGDIGERWAEKILGGKNSNVEGNSFFVDVVGSDGAYYSIKASAGKRANSYSTFSNSKIFFSKALSGINGGHIKTRVDAQGHEVADLGALVFELRPDKISQNTSAENPPKFLDVWKFGPTPFRVIRDNDNATGFVGINVKQALRPLNSGNFFGNKLQKSQIKFSVSDFNKDSALQTVQDVLRKALISGDSATVDRILKAVQSGDINEASLGIHGAGMTEKDLLSSLGYGGIEIEKSGPVTDEEADRIAKKIAAELPDRIYAYSRGAAALGKAFKDDDMPGSPPPVTLVAPASLRSQWGSQDVPRLPAGSVTVTGDRDASIPVKQACKVAKQAGTPLYVHPKKSHKSILYTHGDLAGAEQIDIDKCLADPELPDWGDATVDRSGPEVQLQQSRVRAITGEAYLKSGSKNLRANTYRGGKIAARRKQVKVTKTQLRKIIKEAIRSQYNSAVPRDWNWSAFSKAIDIGLLDLDEIAYEMGFNSAYELDRSISPRAIADERFQPSGKVRFLNAVEAIRKHSLRAEDMGEEEISQLMELPYGG
jgi:hypothetical protein